MRMNGQSPSRLCVRDGPVNSCRLRHDDAEVDDRVTIYRELVPYLVNQIYRAWLTARSQRVMNAARMVVNVKSETGLQALRALYERPLSQHSTGCSPSSVITLQF